MDCGRELTCARTRTESGENERRGWSGIQKSLREQLNTMTDLTGLEVTTSEVGSLPFRISPKNGNNSVAFLEQWVSENKELLDKLLLEHGEKTYKGHHTRCDFVACNSCLQQTRIMYGGLYWYLHVR